MFNLDINFYKKLFDQPLPGEAAQIKMSPSSRFTGLNRPDRAMARSSSVLILLFEKEQKIHFPLIRRTAYPGLHSGQISLPGGKTEPCDASLRETALRETNEELGIDTKQIEIIGTLSQLYIPVSNFNVQPFIGWWHQPEPYSPDHREVDHIIEMPLQQLMGQDGSQTFSQIINNTEVISPFYHYADNIIWGATAMILSELKELLQTGEMINA